MKGGRAEELTRRQIYDGGISESSENESHAGYAYCAVAALSLLSRPCSEDGSKKPRDVIPEGVPDIPALVKFLAYRQFAYVDPPEEEDEDEDNFREAEVGELGLEDLCVGYNGRCNKVADTCYCWWVGGALEVSFVCSLPLPAPSRLFLPSSLTFILPFSLSLHFISWLWKKKKANCNRTIKKAARTGKSHLQTPIPSVPPFQNPAPNRRVCKESVWSARYLPLVSRASSSGYHGRAEPQGV